MKVLYLDWPCFGGENIVYTLTKEMGHEVIRFSHPDFKERDSEDFLQKFDATIEGLEIDCAFSYNFYPLMAEGCHKHEIKYISLVYDSPFVKLYSYKITYPENYCFLFDYQQYIELKNGGINTVYYHPLPVNSELIDIILQEPYDEDKLKCDVSFVGALYNEDHNMYDRMAEKLDDFTRGYLDGLMQSQLAVSGVSFVESMLKGKVLDAMQSVENYAPCRDGVEPLSYVFANYHMARKMTSMERIKLLNAVADRFPLKLFTLDPKATVKNAINCGTVDYYMEMPVVFHESKININISLRSIKSGIPLRCMDILGAGGFLLTNYQEDFLRHFVPGEDYVYFEDEADMLAKIEYYLSHEEERAAIARNGHEKARANHNYKITLEELFEVALQ